MLATLRKASNSFAIKILMVILLFTFVLWGVGDMLRSGPSNYVLKVGDTKINDMEFGNLYREQLAVIQQQFGHEFTKEELNDPQLKQVVVNQVVNRLLQKKLAQDMKFAVSDDMVKFEIAGMPVFMRDGKFDKEVFDGYLRNVGLSESKFVELLREDLSSQNIGLLFSVLRFEPALLTDTLLKARGQTRVFNMVVIPKTAATLTEQPTDAELQRVFEENKAKFIIPEKREVSYVVFGPEVAQIDNVSDKVLKEFYESKKQTFTEAEKRKVLQMVFKDKAKGESALKDLKKGVSFEEVGKKNFPDRKSFLIGEITKNGLSADIANVIFTLPVANPSDLVQSPMGYHIFVVESITPAKVKEFAEIKDKLKDAYLEEKRYEKLNEIAQSVDKEVLAGKTLADIAKDFAFKPQNLVVVSNEDDKDMLKFQGFKSAVFSTDEGSVSTVMPLEGQDKYFLVAVNKVYPAIAKQFAQVKLEVFKLWQDGRTAERLTDISQDVYKTLASGTKPDATAKKFGLSAPKTMNLSLFAESARKMPYEFLKEAFALKTGGCTHPIKDEKQDYMIACVAEIIDADLAQLKDKRAVVSMELMQSAPNELMGQLLRSAKEKYKVEMNNKYLEELEF